MTTSQEDSSVYDVIIAGAGPVGRFLASELRLAKLSVLVLEQLESPHSALKRLPFGMRGLWGPSIEAFYRRGLLEPIASQPKLAATIRGDAPDGLLDSYTSERHPIGARILDWTRAQVAVMRPNRHARALEAILRDVLDTRDGATYFAERLWGVSIRYDLGDEHPLQGRSCADFELEDGTRLGTLLRAGQGLLLDFGEHASLRALDGLWGECVRYVAGNAKDRLGLRALLVRPDGFVAWASDTTPSPEEVTRAAAKCFASREPHAIGR
jgi:hypothetical protein